MVQRYLPLKGVRVECGEAGHAALGRLDEHSFGVKRTVRAGVRSRLRAAVPEYGSVIKVYRLRQAGELVRRLGRPTPTADPSALAEQSALLRSLRKLPTKQAAALVLRHYHGYSNREIAASLGVPEATVASRLANGRKRLLDGVFAARKNG